MSHFSKRTLIVGSGLIGTSIALGLKKSGVEVWIEDEDPEAEDIAQNLILERGISHRVYATNFSPELIIIATPIAVIAELLLKYGRLHPHAILMDIGGLKVEVLSKVERFSEVSRRFCSTHPMSGREIAGPLAARGDLFEGRIWIYTPTKFTEEYVVATILQVIAQLGGTPVSLDATTHDEVIAGVSHLPQVLSSLLSLTLEEMTTEHLALSGQGLKDVSRLAASNSEMWANLLHANQRAILPLLDKLSNNLNDLSTSIASDDLRKTKELLTLARDNHQRIPGKHGGINRNYWYVPIVIEDKPGQLAAIFDSCATAGVNIEDLTIEHTPGMESGLVTLALAFENAEKLYNQLLSDGWNVRIPRDSLG